MNATKAAILMAAVLLAGTVAAGAETYKEAFDRGVAFYGGHRDPSSGVRIQDYARARQYFARAAELSGPGKEQDTARFFLGMSDCYLRNDGPAMETLRGVVDSANITGAQRSQAQLSIAEMEFRRGDRVSACREYRKVFDIKDADPAHVALACIGEGRAWEAEGDPEAALEAYGRAAAMVQKVPRVALEGKFRAGLCLYGQGRYPEARQAFQECRAIHEKIPPAGRDNNVKGHLASADIGAANCYRAEGDYAAALKTWREFYESAKSGAPWVYGPTLYEAVEGMDMLYRGILNQADAAREAQQYASARKIYADLAGMPEVPGAVRARALLGTGHSYFAQGRYSDAMAEYEKVLAMDEGYWAERAEAQMCVAHCNRLLNRTDLSKAAYRKVLAMKNVSPRMLDEAERYSR